MIELPEAVTLARQAGDALVGRTIVDAEANHTPHKLMWFFGDPAQYRDLLVGATVTGATHWGGHVELAAEDLRILVSEGATPRLLPPGQDAPPKHQLRLDLDGGSTLVVAVAMYGGIQVFHDGENDNPYYQVAMAKPTPLSSDFTFDYFAAMLAEAPAALSAKAFLATEQRVPGLGNGVLQDVLWNARLHPRRKVAELSGEEQEGLYDAVTATLAQMAKQGGRDTERDLFGAPGGYATVLSRLSLELPCPRCGGRKVKESYLGGAVYFCMGCQAG
jgi:formamidopyrimidine-DNA glycosylase